MLDKCTSYYDKDQNKMELMDVHNRFASMGLRVLALAYGKDLDKLTFVGLGKFPASIRDLMTGLRYFLPIQPL